MQKSGKLELTWVGKYDTKVIEPRIFVEDFEKSYGDPNSQNMLIHGDNLIALQALIQDFAGKIKCIYIDPPFNTGEAFENYDDNLEESIWLTLMRQRLELIHELLADDGTLFVHIDDANLGYLMVLLDEIFLRANRLYTITFKQGSATGHKAINPGCVTTTNFILMYAKDKRQWIPNKVYIKAVSATLSDDQSLLIYGTKIQSNLYLPENIEVKKIPKDLLQKCFFESEVR